MTTQFFDREGTPVTVGTVVSRHSQECYRRSGHFIVSGFHSGRAKLVSLKWEPVNYDLATSDELYVIPTNNESNS